MPINSLQAISFSKNWASAQSTSTKIVDTKHFLRSKHSYRDKDIIDFSTNKTDKSTVSKPSKNTIAFGSLQSAWKSNEIPKVTKGFFGDPLTFDNVSTKQVDKDSFVLVGKVKSGYMTDKQVIDYFMQFAGYPKYRRYILDTLKVLDNMREIK